MEGPTSTCVASVAASTTPVHHQQAGRGSAKVPKATRNGVKESTSRPIAALLARVTAVSTAR